MNDNHLLPDRKLDHIELATKAHMAHAGSDDRFYYEPLLSAHPDENASLAVSFLGKQLGAPLWVSSMTGGTEKAYEINSRLAEACTTFKLGMGLGSCRSLLNGYERLSDFDMRATLGYELPFYANLGIAQVEELINKRELHRIDELIQILRADGLIVHINPLQEWLQPEGDMINRPPLETLRELVTSVSYPVIVKEVGQGMGPESIAAILQLPIAAFELAAHGGTNFSKLELLRASAGKHDAYQTISNVGHTAVDMVEWINALTMDTSSNACQQFIISGGIRDFLDGYYLMGKLRWPSVYGQASGFLKHAMESQAALNTYIGQQIAGLKLAQAYLRIR